MDSVMRCHPAAVAAIWAVLFAAVGQATAASQRPVCQMSEALIGAVDNHLTEWDNQLDIALNETYNCSTYLEFIYLSRDRIRLQLEYIRGNFSAEDELFKAQGEEGQSTTWAMTYMSKAAALVSAHIHVHGVLGASRRECLSEHLQLLFLMSLRRLKNLLHGELRQLWIIFQGTAELFRQGAGKWLSEIVELFEADLRTMESIMVSYVPPEEQEALAKAALEAGGDAAKQAGERSSRPGPPLPPYGERDPDGITLSTIEVLRRNAFDEWDTNKYVIRALLRHVLPRDSHVADFCAGNGLTADFLNDTGLVSAYAFDASPNIQLLSKGAVEHVGLHTGAVQLWRSFDVALCLTAAKDFGSKDEVWNQAFQNIDGHSTSIAVLHCGSEEVQKQAVAAAAKNAPSMKLDTAMGNKLIEANATGFCVFSRS